MQSQHKFYYKAQKCQKTLAKEMSSGKLDEKTGSLLQDLEFDFQYLLGIFEKRLESFFNKEMTRT